MIKAFANAIRDAQASLPRDILNTGSRFDVYRSNYFSQLIDVLSDVFPVAKKLVGSDFFGALATEYATQFPPTSPLLTEYGGDFSNFLDNFEPARQVPYLADMARLEWARSNAQGSGALPFRLISTEDDILQALHLPIRCTPGATLLKSSYPVGTIWTHHQREVPDPVPHWIGETVAIWPANGDLHQLIIPDQEHDCLSLIQDRMPFINHIQKSDDEQQATLMIETFVKYLNLGFLSIDGPKNGELTTCKPPVLSTRTPPALLH